MAKLIAALALVFTVNSCCFFRGDCSPPVQNFLDCSVEAIKSEWVSIVPIVKSILQSGDDWEAQLLTLAGHVGVDVLTCALNAAMSDYAVASKSPAFIQRYGNEGAASFAARARLYMLKHSGGKQIR